MDQFTLTKQILEFNKTSFDNTFNAMAMLQDQTEQMVTSLMEQATWLPADGKKALIEWVETFKKGRGEFKRTVD
ncbi:MAG: hypothetical protein AAGU11_06005, partial [Syntrophobacteraceae bacterium]